MTEIYGHRWVSAYGEIPCDTWARGLSDISPEQIGRALTECLKREEAWPPSLPEFRNLCKPPKRENAAMYREFPPALEKKLTDEDRAKAREHVKEAMKRIGSDKAKQALANYRERLA